MKCKLYFSSLPEATLEIIQQLVVRALPDIAPDAWVKCIEFNTTGPYMVLRRALKLWNACAEEERIIHAGVLLRMLCASSRFDKSLSSHIDLEYYAMSLTTLVSGLREVCLKGSVLLPSDVSVLKALRRQIMKAEAQLPDNAGRILPEIHNVKRAASPWGQWEDDKESIRGSCFRALHYLQDLIKEARRKQEAGLLERQIRRAEASYTLDCCNEKCTTVAGDEKGIPRLHCAACRKQHYCSVACQRACWKEHKLVCFVLAAENEEEDGEAV